MTVAARLSRAIALLLLAWQAVVVQAHVHVGAPSAPVVSAGASATHTLPRPEAPFQCPVCREVAHAGQFLSPGPVLVAALLPVAMWRAATSLPTLQVEQRSPAWRSRAPPNFI